MARNTRRFAGKFIELRYELMPYLYTGIEEASRTGLPGCGRVSRISASVGFLWRRPRLSFGSDFLSRQVTTEMAMQKKNIVAAGDWYDFWTTPGCRAKKS